jgi:hypothetical protein
MATAKKTPRKAAKKKRVAKKKTLKLSGVALQGASEINIKTVKYLCAGGNCTAVPPSRRMNRGDLIVLFATNTGVTITFTSGSPFISGNTQIVLAQGGIDFEVVDESIAHGTSFHYNLTCTAPLCATLQNPPEMIVD